MSSADTSTKCWRVTGKDYYSVASEDILGPFHELNLSSRRWSEAFHVLHLTNTIPTPSLHVVIEGQTNIHCVLFNSLPELFQWIPFCLSTTKSQISVPCNPPSPILSLHMWDKKSIVKTAVPELVSGNECQCTKNVAPRWAITKFLWRPVFMVGISVSERRPTWPPSTDVHSQLHCRTQCNDLDLSCLNVFALPFWLVQWVQDQPTNASRAARHEGPQRENRWYTFSRWICLVRSAVRQVH